MRALRRELPRGRVALSTALGAGAACAAVGLTATSAWLISRAAEHPGASALGIAIAGVQFFALSRALLRYAERLTGHDAAFRALAATARRRLPAPGAARAGGRCPRSAKATCSRASCTTSTRCRTCCCASCRRSRSRSSPVRRRVALVWWLLPAAGLILLVALVLAATAVPWLTGSAGAPRTRRARRPRAAR